MSRRKQFPDEFTIGLTKNNEFVMVFTLSDAVDNEVVSMKEYFDKAPEKPKIKKKKEYMTVGDMLLEQATGQAPDEWFDEMNEHQKAKIKEPVIDDYTRITRAEKAAEKARLATKEPVTVGEDKLSEQATGTKSSVDTVHETETVSRALSDNENETKTPKNRDEWLDEMNEQQKAKSKGPVTAGSSTDQTIAEAVGRVAEATASQDPPIKKLTLPSVAKIKKKAKTPPTTTAPQSPENAPDKATTPNSGIVEELYRCLNPRCKSKGELFPASKRVNGNLCPTCLSVDIIVNPE